MTTAQVPSHPLLAAVRTTRKALAGVAEVEPVYLPAEVKQAALLELAAAESQLVELRLRILAASDDVAELAAHRDAGAWLADRTNLDRPATHGDLKLAQALDAKYARVREAMRAGAVNRAQAVVMVHALDKLPGEVDQLAKKRAERHLVELAEHHTPKELRVLGEHLFEVIAPEVAEDALGRALEREEQGARTKTSLRLRAQGDGTTRITILCPDAVAARLEAYLEASTSPRASTGSTTLGVPRHRALGQAFVAMLEQLDTSRLPDHGGDATTVTVTVRLEQLTKELGAAGLIGGLGGEIAVSATQARRLACNAKIIPAVLGGKGGGPRPRPVTPSLLARPAQGDAAPRQALPCRRLQRSGDMDRGPPREAVVQGRQDRPGRRRTPLLLAPPPRARHQVPARAPRERRLEIPPQNLRVSVSAGWSSGGHTARRGVP